MGNAAAELRPRPTFELEAAELQLHGGPVAGVDEAGRGPLAGPVVAAAVILDPERISRITGAASGCGGCEFEFHQLVAEHNQEA